MSDLQPYIKIRKKTDLKFHQEFNSGYEELKMIYKILDDDKK